MIITALIALNLSNKARIREIINEFFLKSVATDAMLK